MIRLWAYVVVKTALSFCPDGDDPFAQVVKPGGQEKIHALPGIHPVG